MISLARRAILLLLLLPPPPPPPPPSTPAARFGRQQKLTRDSKFIFQQFVQTVFRCLFHHQKFFLPLREFFLVRSRSVVREPVAGVLAAWGIVIPVIWCCTAAMLGCIVVAIALLLQLICCCSDAYTALPQLALLCCSCSCLSTRKRQHL